MDTFAKRLLTDVVSYQSLLRNIRHLLERIGEITVLEARKLLQFVGLVWAVVLAGSRPSTWTRPIGHAVLRQILWSGVEAVGIVCFLAFALGVLLVVQYQTWVGSIIQSRLLAPVLVAVMVRELGPLLVNLLMIARSGNTLATELGLMHVSGEIRMIEGQGVDPLQFFVLPRVFGLVISTCCLTVVFVTVSFLGAYLCGQWVDAKTGPFSEFAQNALGAVAQRDIFSLLFKATIPPLLIGSLCCAAGLSAGNSVADVPRSSRIAVQRSVVILALVSACISIATYL